MLSVLLIVRAVGRAVTVTRGQTLIEYTLILALIAIVTMLLMSAVGWDLQETFDGIENFLGTLDAQRSYYAAQRTLVLSRLEAASNRVQLYRALGGDALLAAAPVAAPVGQ